MITREQIPAVLDHPVYDSSGSKIGDARHVFFDDVTGEPEWVSVKTGLFGTSESFVPIHDASVVEDHLEVPYAKNQVKDAPNVDVDAGGHLSEHEEHRLYEYYGIDWDAAWQQAAQPTADTAQARTADEAMTRSEEEMHVGTERREAGRRCRRGGPGSAVRRSPTGYPATVVRSGSGPPASDARPQAPTDRRRPAEAGVRRRSAGLAGRRRDAVPVRDRIGRRVRRRPLR
ncbi:photosystem reaction center subunit H [Streptomyces olindensis]|nr:photosystem reaction center subunit H [Streptomyces olindensis]